eukprot:6187911-Pleurochrysis_carterae.AAC.4
MESLINQRSVEEERLEKSGACKERRTLDTGVDRAKSVNEGKNEGGCWERPWGAKERVSERRAV